MRALPAAVMIAAAALGAAARPAAASDERDALEVVATYKQKHKALPKAFADAHGYAVFPNVGKGGLGLGAAHGNGWVYERGALVGRSSLHQLTIGLQLGGQSYSEVVLFQTRDAFEDFKRGKLKLDAQASAIALNARASADLAYRNGVAIITMAKGGLMYEASVGGQKFSFKPLDGDR